MKQLILLTLAWHFLLAFCEFCEIDNNEDGFTLHLNCKRSTNMEGLYNIKDKSVSCGVEDMLIENITTIRNDYCTFNDFHLFKNCKRFILHANPIQSIRKEMFIEMQQLEFIEIENDGAQVAASAFSELPNLRHVSLSGNNLNVSESTFQGAHQLKLLEFADSSKSRLPPGFFRDLKSLEDLDFTFSSFSTLSDVDFNGFKNVKSISFNVNGIWYLIGNSFHIMKNLKYLLLFGNNLHGIDSMNFSQMHNLIALNFGKNHIKELNASHFSGLTNLRKLDLRLNKISRIDNGAFLTLNNLKKLDLSDNRLPALYEYTFNGLEKLQYLNLKKNFISAIDVSTFSALTKLIQVDLSSQKGLITIDLNAFPQFINLQTKTVIYTAISSESDEIEQEELQWFEKITSYSKKNNEVESIDQHYFRHFQLNKDYDSTIDLQNLTQRVIDQSLIFGNLDLSDNNVTLVNFN